ncbi:MAG TPA: sialate O-acetylesterase [Puia sp.]|nr:sialate O-acetylesterase [Puia sp.]
MKCIDRWMFWALTLLTGPSGIAQVRVPRMVGDGMVLQRDMPIRIWGFASPGEKVTVRFDGETASGVTGDDGKWMAVIAPRKAGGPYTMDIDGINHIWVKNIMVGEVWFCTGQYVLQLPLDKVKDKYAGPIAHAGDVPVRRFVIHEHYDYKGPRNNVSGGRWETADGSNVGGFSALEYLFALQVYDRYRVPVGLIDACVADAPAEAWLSPDALRFFPAEASAANRYADSVFPEGGGPADRMAPGGLFNGMIAPAATYTVRGILSYHGEADVARANEYAEVFPILIGDWRRHWSEGQLPVLYVQLEGRGPVTQNPQESAWAVVRDAQREALRLPATGMAVAGDLNPSGGPYASDLDLDELAKRLFLSAESVAYGKKNFIYTGPVFDNMKVHGDKVHVMFSDAGSDLIVKGGGELKGFTIAGEDNRFLTARAVIDGKKLIVWSDSVVKPVAVRYGWADNPYGANLYNRDILFKNGLPAPTFSGRAGGKK